MFSSDPEYDTDAISLTSTVKSDNDNIYDIKCILSEGLDQSTGKDVMKFLIEWEGYPMHECTWEPEDNLLDTGLLTPWANDRVRMGTRKFRKYCQNNEERFNRAREEFKRLQDIRQKKRAKKRKNLSKRNQRVIGGDNSEEGIPPRQQRRVSEVKAKSSEAIPTHSQELYNSLFVDSQDPSPLRPPPALDQRGRGPTARRPLVARPPPIEQSTDDEDEALSADDSAESLLGELAAKAKNKTRKVTSRSRGNKEPNIGNSVLLSGSPCQKATRPLVKPATDQATTEAHIQAQRKSPKPTRTLTASVHSTTPSTEQKEQGRRPNDSAAQVAPTKASNNLGSKPSSTIVGSAAISKPTKPATSASAQETTIPVASPTSRRTGTASKAGNPIRITNAKKEPPRRKEWDTENVLYGKLKFRGLADKRSHAEGTPDLNALEFVGAGAPIMARPRPSNPADNLYSRRETGSRRIQEFDRDTSPRRDSIEEGGPLRDWEMNKVPMVCPHWRLSSNCPYTPERCRFMHRHKDAQGCDLPVGPIDGKIPGKYRKPPLTCLFYQKTAEGCRKTADQCDYAHYNTGFIPFSKTDTTPVHIDPNEVPLSEQSLSRILETNKAENQNAANHPVLSYQQKRRLKPAQLTCWYWKNGNECRNTPETCSFQHHDTGIVASAPAGARVPWRNTPQSRPSFERKSMDDMDMQDNDASLPTTSAAPPVESKQTQLPVVLSPPSTVDDGLRTLSLPVALPRTASTCLQLQDKMELAFKINYVDMFQWSDDGTERKMIDRTAFLMYHPLDHLEELELITRWLLMHHVEVSNVWFEGAWEWWAKKIEGTSSGIVILHPDFEYFSEMKGFGALLRKQVRVWSLGVQEGPEYDSASSLVPSSKQHECVEIFPAGGFIYITDDIFDSRPRQALDIIKLFIAKIQKLRPTKDPESPWQEADNIDLHWRLCVRPELMEYLFDKCEEKAKALEAGDSDALARAELYTLLSDTDYIEQDSPISPLSLKADKFPIMSERRIVAKEEPVDYFNSLARSREKANLRMIRYYAGLHIDMRRDYRLFYIVHTDPFGAPSKQWQQEYGTITDILTPEKCIVELSKEGDDKGRLFDFYERYLVLPQDESVTATHGKQVTRVQTEEVMESQASPESDEIRPTL